MPSGDGHLQGAIAGADKLMNDGRMDRMLTSVERLTDADKLERLLDDMSAIADQMARIGPDIPAVTRDLASTLREAVIVLKALQKSWLLDDESRDVREELRTKKPAD